MPDFSNLLGVQAPRSGTTVVGFNLEDNGIQVRERKELDTGELWFGGDRWRTLSFLHLAPVGILCKDDWVVRGSGAWGWKQGFEEVYAKVASSEVWTLKAVEDGWYSMDGRGVVAHFGLGVAEGWVLMGLWKMMCAFAEGRKTGAAPASCLVPRHETCPPPKSCLELTNPFA